MKESMAKKTTQKPVKKTVAKPTVTAKPKKTAAKKSNLSIDQVNVQILDKLKSLNVEPQLQSDINWCLGSYRNDHNPVGLYATSKKALAVFTSIKEKNTRAISAKLIADIQKVLAK